MKRYNHDGVPMPMVEDANGYWVTYEDYNLLSLECNKKVERIFAANAANENKTPETSEQIDLLHNIIVVLSIISFGAVSAVFWMWD
jgi:hypothetical protein